MSTLSTDRISSAYWPLQFQLANESLEFECAHALL